MLASLLAAFASGETLYIFKRLKRDVVAYAAAGIFAAVAAGFLVAAGYMATADALGPIWAALIFAGGFLLIAVIIVIAHRMAESGRQREIERRRSTEMAGIGTAAALAVLPSVMRGKAGVATVLAPAAGVGAYALYRLFRRPPPADHGRRGR